MRIREQNGALWLEEVSCFQLEQTFECGQCFRWERVKHAGDDGSVVYEGIVRDMPLRLTQRGHTVCMQPADAQSYRLLWQDYFDLKRDYRQVQAVLARDAVLERAIAFGSGIRVLKQDFFETLISFILSQQSNIPRIRQVIAALCAHFGEPVRGLGRVFYTFPTAARLSRLTKDEIGIIRAGYRGRYVLDAARKVAAGEIDEQLIRRAPLQQALAELMKMNGVGIKVANCVALFGAGRLDAFPADVWIKRALHTYYDSGEAGGHYGAYAGIAQQYLYYLARSEKIR